MEGQCGAIHPSCCLVAHPRRTSVVLAPKDLDASISEMVLDLSNVSVPAELGDEGSVKISSGIQVFDVIKPPGTY